MLNRIACFSKDPLALLENKLDCKPESVLEASESNSNTAKGVSKLLDYLERAPQIWAPFQDSFSGHYSSQGIASFFSQMDFKERLRRENPAYEHLPDPVLRALTKNVRGVALLRNPGFAEIWGTICRMAENESLVDALVSSDPGSLGRDERVSREWESAHGVSSHLWRDFLVKIREANSIRLEIKKLPILQILRLIKSNSKQSNAVLSTLSDRNKPIPAFYPKLRKMVVNFGNGNNVASRPNSDSQGKMDVKSKMKRLGWDVGSPFFKRNRNELVKMEKKSWFKKEQLNGIEFKNPRLRVAREITRFIRKRDKSLSRAGWNSPSLFNFKRKSETSRRALKESPGSMKELKKLMKSSMVNIKFK